MAPAPTWPPRTWATCTMQTPGGCTRVRRDRGGPGTAECGSVIPVAADLLVGVEDARQDGKYHRQAGEEHRHGDGCRRARCPSAAGGTKRRKPAEGRRAQQQAEMQQAAAPRAGADASNRSGTARAGPWAGRTGRRERHRDGALPSFPDPTTKKQAPRLGRFRAKQESDRELGQRRDREALTEKGERKDGHLGWGWRLAGAEGGRVVAFGASGSGRMQRAGRRTGGQARCAASAQCPSCLPAHGPAAIRDNPARPAWQMRRTPSGGGRSSTTPSSTLRLLSRRRVFTCAETLSGCSLSKWPSMSTKSSDGGREGVCGVTLKGPAGLWSVDVMDLPIS